MPELPEVETVARDLRGLVLGAEITGAACHWERTLRTHAPETIGPALAGRRILGVGRRGKQLVLDLSGGAVLTVHLKMTGQLFVVANDAPMDRHVRLVIAFADGRDLRFRDIRKFGKIGLYQVDPATGEAVHEAGGAAVFAGTGPEPLDDAFTLRAFRHRIRARHGRLKPLLLDQSFVAGIGNIYADEALWRARIHPRRPSRSLAAAEIAGLRRGIRAALAAGIARQGATLRDYRDPSGEAGRMQDELLVYGRGDQPCRRCGVPVARAVVAGRGTWFCPACQPERP